MWGNTPSLFREGHNTLHFLCGENYKLLLLKSRRYNCRSSLKTGFCQSWIPVYLALCCIIFSMKLYNLKVNHTLTKYWIWSIIKLQARFDNKTRTIIEWGRTAYWFAHTQISECLHNRHGKFSLCELHKYTTQITFRYKWIPQQVLPLRSPQNPHPPA